jgi:hypothetical protein
MDSYLYTHIHLAIAAVCLIFVGRQLAHLRRQGYLKYSIRLNDIISRFLVLQDSQNSYTYP